MKTTKQIADELGATKQQIYRYIKRNHIKEAYQENGVLMYDDATITLIKQGFLRVGFKSPEVPQSASKFEATEALIKTLQEQLTAKDKQIEALNARLEEVTSALVSAQETAKAAQVLHAGTMQQLEAPAEKKGVFSWLRKKS